MGKSSNLRPPDPIVRDIRRRLGNETILKLIQDYKAGSSTIQLRKKYGLSKTSILKLLAEHGVEMRPSTR